MNVVFIVPTGIGAEIGGHAGDATPAAKLIASVCDKLFIHPNIVNASDINEMTSNMLYVEGSILDRFLEGKVGLREVSGNKILVVVNPPVKTETINAVNAARTTIGADIEIIELKRGLIMEASIKNGRAGGKIYNVEAMIEQVKDRKFDVLVVNTPIDSNDDEVLNYLKDDGGTNVWGGVEAILSKRVSEELNKPVIHAPVENSKVFASFNEVVDPRKAAEMVSVCYLHCCLKGAHVAPKIETTLWRGYWNEDIDFLVTPINVVGRPHMACLSAGIPIIAVRENTTTLNDLMPIDFIITENYLKVTGIISAKNTTTLNDLIPKPPDFIIAENYLEAAGIISAKRAGVSIESVRRPMKGTLCI